MNKVSDSLRSLLRDNEHKQSDKELRLNAFLRSATFVLSRVTRQIRVKSGAKLGGVHFLSDREGVRIIIISGSHRRGVIV